MRLLIVTLVSLFSLSAFASFRMQVEDIDVQKLRFSSGSQRGIVMNFVDGRGQSYFIRCENYMFSKRVHFQFLGNNISSEMENCSESLETIQNQVKSGKKIDFIEMSLSYQEGSRRDQLELIVNYL